MRRDLVTARPLLRSEAVSPRRPATSVALVAALGLALAAPAHATTARQCTSRWDEMVKHVQTGPFTYRSFMASCLSGAAPATLPTMDAPAGAPAGATARCRDGTYAALADATAACEHHRGVAGLLR